MTELFIKAIFAVFLVCMVGIAAGALLAVIDTVKNPEPEINEKKTLSACTSCRLRKWCLDSVQHHDVTDDCYVKEL